MKPRSRGDLYYWTGYLLIMVTAGCLLWRAQRTAARARALLEEKKQEQAWVASRSPAVNRDNELAIAQDVVRASGELAEIQARLQAVAGRWFESPAPLTAIEAFVDLATFKERLRHLAAQARVRLKPDEHFGFASHATEGPAASAIPVVHRQRLAVQFLIETLWESAPASLVAVRRERPKADPAPEQQGQPQDFFVIPATLSLRQTALVEAESFRLEFTGQSVTLRSFLNKLASSGQPFVVRSVEVEPVDVISPVRPAENGVTDNSSVTLTKQYASKFTVMLELVRRAGAAAPNSG